MLAEVLDYDFRFLLDIVRMQLLELGQCLGVFLLGDGGVDQRAEELIFIVVCMKKFVYKGN